MALLQKLWKLLKSKPASPVGVEVAAKARPSATIVMPKEAAAREIHKRVDYIDHAHHGADALIRPLAHNDLEMKLQSAPEQDLDASWSHVLDG